MFRNCDTDLSTPFIVACRWFKNEPHIMQSCTPQSSHNFFRTDFCISFHLQCEIAVAPGELLSRLKCISVEVYQSFGLTVGKAHIPGQQNR